MLGRRPGQLFQIDFGERAAGVGRPTALGDGNFRVMRLTTCPARRCRTVLNSRPGLPIRYPRICTLHPVFDRRLANGAHSLLASSPRFPTGFLGVNPRRQDAHNRCFRGPDGVIGR
jgi:hypothetical protein